MAFEIVEITLAANNQSIVRVRRVPAGSSFSDLGREVQAAMGWNGGEAHEFRVPGAGAKIDDESLPMDTYGRMPLEYVYGRFAHRIRFLGRSERDLTGTWFSERRSAGRSEAVRGCVRRWYEGMKPSVRMDAKTMDRVAEAIASSRKRDAYLDLTTMRVTGSEGPGRSLAIRTKDSAFLAEAAVSFSEGHPSVRRPDVRRGDWYQRFMSDVSRSPKMASAWSSFLRERSRAEAERWATKNGLLAEGDRDVGRTFLPCMHCGKELEAVEDRSLGGTVIGGRQRFPMTVRCPDCRKATQLFMFNDGFVTDYAFRKDRHPCRMARDAILARGRALAEADDGERARLLMLAALECYRCDMSGESAELVSEASMTDLVDAAIVSSFIEDEESPVTAAADPLFEPVSKALAIRKAEGASEVRERTGELESSLEASELPEWLAWELRCTAMMGHVFDEWDEYVFDYIVSTLGRYLDRLASYDSPSSDDYRRACRMFEVSVMYALSHERLELAKPAIGLMLDTFDGRLDNVPARTVALFRRGLYRMIVGGDDDGAVDDLTAVVLSQLSDDGRGPVTGRRAFAAMAALYIYDPDTMDLVTLALNSMNAMSVTGAISDEELSEMESVVSRILKSVGGYEEARTEVRSRTNLDLGPEPEQGLALDDLMGIAFSYYLE